MTSQVNDTLIAAKKLEQETLELMARHQLDLQEIQRTIAKLELALERQSKIISEHSGRVLELTATVGRVLDPGTKLATLLKEEQTSPLVCFCYFQVKDGKRIVPGIAPDGARLGEARALWESHWSSRVRDALPGQWRSGHQHRWQFGGRRALVAENRQIEVLTELRADSSTPSGFAWTSSRGPESRITLGTTANVVVEGNTSPLLFCCPSRRWPGS